MTTNSRFLNNGSKDSPQMNVYLNLGSLLDLHGDSAWPDLDGLPRYQRLLADGFEGVQFIFDDLPIAGLPLSYCGQDRINTPAEADCIAAKHATRGDLCLTVHAGWGLENDEEAFRLVEAILTASARYSLPIFIETHRATITQDIWRTVQLTKKFPEIRFNGDFSHYYCGQELVYGDWAEKLAFMEPIFLRVGFLHGRIASSGSMQVPIGPDLISRPSQAYGLINYLDHFKELWIRAMLGFLRTANPGDVLIFAPEILPSKHYYARRFPNAAGEFAEESDRYLQALLYRDLSRACFAEANQIFSLSAGIDHLES